MARTSGGRYNIERAAELTIWTKSKRQEIAVAIFGCFLVNQLVHDLVFLPLWRCLLNIELLSSILKSRFQNSLA